MQWTNSIRPFLIFWLLLNLVQAFFTGLMHDESYYWFYAQDLDWGYFDHPPMIALFVKMGLWLPGELGVRLITTLSSAATLWLIWETIGGKELKLFLAMAMSTLIIHVGGFLAVPDIPFMFFAALFFYFFKKYLDEDNWLTILGLTIATVGMAYSKYQGILVIGFAMLPNLKLLKRPSIWVLALVSALALVPHFIWQMEHGWPTFVYQFFERSLGRWKWEFFLNYPLGQLLIFGPLVSFILFPAAVRYKAQSDFDKTMQWCFYGFFAFFLYQSFKMRVEPNWTVMAAVPLFYLAYHHVVKHPNKVKWVYKLLIPSLVLISFVRLIALVDILPPNNSPLKEFHGWDEWAADISELAGDKTTIFSNNFQHTSKYMFYSGKDAHSVNYTNYGGKHHDLMFEKEEALQGQSVLFIKEARPDDSTATQLGNIQRIKHQVINDFHYFNRIKIIPTEREYAIATDSTYEIAVEVQNLGSKPVDFTKYRDELSIEYALFWYGKPRFYKKAINDFPIKTIAPGQSIPLKLKVFGPPEAGAHWRFKFAIKSSIGHGRNCDMIKVE